MADVPPAVGTPAVGGPDDAGPPAAPGGLRLSALLDALPSLRRAAPGGSGTGGSGTGGSGTGDEADPLVLGCTLDSRRVEPGDLYAALPGARTHGARHAAAAVGTGAVAVLTDVAGCPDAAATGVPVLVADAPRDVLGEVAATVHGRPADALALLGVTGTNGKTTTTTLADAALRAAGVRTVFVGTVRTAVAGTEVPSARTTPEAPDLQALLARGRDAGAGAAVLEVSSHALRLGRVDGARADVAVFTGLSRDHLDFHRDMEDYYAAKASLFTARRARAAAVWVDDPWGRRLAREVSGAGEVPLWTVGTGGAPTRAPHVRVTTAAADARGSRVLLHAPGTAPVELAVALPGAFNVANAALAAVAVTLLAGSLRGAEAVLAVPPTGWRGPAVRRGLDLAAAAAGVAGCVGVPGRLERVEVGQPWTALVDYAHTPDAVETVLAALRPLTPGRLVVVLGCGGDRDRGKRPLMGEVAARGADVAVLTSDNPRSEDPLAVLGEMSAGAAVVDGAQVVVEPDRAAAVARAVAGAGPGDTVLVAGKGHETGQEVAGVVLPFDDREVLAAAARRALGAAVPVL